MIDNDSRPLFMELLKRRTSKTITVLGGASLVVACASPPQTGQPEVSIEATTSSQAPNQACRFNGDAGDADPNHLNKGEAVAVFPGVLEYGITDVRPILELGAKGVKAAFEVVYNPEARGFRFAPVPPESLAKATWRADASKVDPAAPEKMAQFDGCLPDAAHSQGRDKIPASFVTLEGVGETALDKTPDPHGSKLDVPSFLLETDMPLPDGKGPRPPKVSIAEWFDQGVFGVGLSNRQAEQLGKDLSKLDVPLSGSYIRSSRIIKLHDISFVW